MNFKSASLNEGDFSWVIAVEADFAAAKLQEANLLYANCTQANFKAAHLEGAVLDSANLEGAILSEVFFDRTTRLHNMRLNGRHGMALLLDIHWGDVNIAVVPWSEVPADASQQLFKVLEDSKSFLRQDGSIIDTGDVILDPHESALRANRQLAVVLRSQGLTEDADRYAYRARVLQRKLSGLQGKWIAWLGWTFIGGISGYGYKIWRIMAAYGVILGAFTISYWLLGVHSFKGESSLRALWDSFLVSLSAIHGRTTFEQLGAWSAAAWVAAIESVFGIVLEGIFVAMLIQRFFAR